VLARTFIRLTTTVIVVAVALMLAFPFFLSLQAVATCGSANAKIDSCFGHRFVPHGNKKPAPGRAKFRKFVKPAKERATLSDWWDQGRQ
jgi:hypothetical protein